MRGGRPQGWQWTSGHGYGRRAVAPGIDAEVEKDVGHPEEWHLTIDDTSAPPNRRTVRSIVFARWHEAEEWGDHAIEMMTHGLTPTETMRRLRERRAAGHKMPTIFESLGKERGNPPSPYVYDSDGFRLGQEGDVETGREPIYYGLTTTEESIRRRMRSIEERARSLADLRVRRERAKGAPWPDPDTTDPLETVGWPEKEGRLFDHAERELADLRAMGPMRPWSRGGGRSNPPERFSPGSLFGTIGAARLLSAFQVLSGREVRGATPKRARDIITKMTLVVPPSSAPKRLYTLDQWLQWLAEWAVESGQMGWDEPFGWAVPAAERHGWDVTGSW